MSDDKVFDRQLAAAYAKQFMPIVLSRWSDAAQQGKYDDIPASVRSSFTQSSLKNSPNVREVAYMVAFEENKHRAWVDKPGPLAMVFKVILGVVRFIVNLMLIAAQSLMRR